MDYKGNIGIPLMGAMGATASSSPSIAVSGFRTITNEPDIFELSEQGGCIGGSVLIPGDKIPVYIGGDLAIVGELDKKLNENHYGATTSIGTGIASGCMNEYCDGGMRSMGKIWYECRLNFDVMSILPFILLGAIILLPILMSNDLKKKGSVPISEIKEVKIFFSCMITFIGIFNLVYIISQIDLYKKIVIPYRNGDYQIVEGYAENFEPMDSNGWPPEKFEINGVKFKYSHHWAIPAGYRREKGDCMIGNGQHLKVGYVHSGRSWGNIIVYIEELP